MKKKLHKCKAGMSWVSGGRKGDSSSSERKWQHWKKILIWKYLGRDVPEDKPSRRSTT
jgi:hypothetical protein